MVPLESPLSLRRTGYLNTAFWTAYGHRFPLTFFSSIRIFKMRHLLGCWDCLHSQTSQAHDSILDRILQLSNDRMHLSHCHVAIYCNFKDAHDERAGSS